MPSLPRGHLRIYFSPGPVFRNSLGSATFPRMLCVWPEGGSYERIQGTGVINHLVCGHDVCPNRVERNLPLRTETLGWCSPRLPSNKRALSGTYTSSVPLPALSLTDLRTQITRRARSGKMR